MQNFSTFKQLARTITVVENELPGYAEILEQLRPCSTPVIGITGAPGAGKSSLANALLTHYLQNDKRIAIIAIDPSSPFNYGSLLGDRVRMSQHFNNPKVFIRSLASRGSLGGLCEKIIEIVDVVRQFRDEHQQPLFDLVVIETVGVGQSEVEIAGLADMTIVTFTPAAGDDVQSMKAGLMEIADIFVVNKADMPMADSFTQNLEKLVHERFEGQWQPPVIKTIATENKGIDILAEAIDKYFKQHLANPKKAVLMADKAWRLIQKQRMSQVNKLDFDAELSAAMQQANFNMFTFIKKYYT